MKEEKIKLLYGIVWTIIVMVFFLTPFVFMILVSLSQDPEFLYSWKTFKPTLTNYELLLTDSSLHFLNYLRNSLIIAAISTLVCILIVSLSAYAITRMKFQGRIFILFLVLAISMFPQISIVEYLFKMMTGLDWINTYKSLIFPYIGLTIPLSLWILVSYFSKIPKEIDKAAMIDGCSRWQIILKIIFPLAMPGIFSASILAFIFTFSEFMFALMLTYDHKARTIPVGIALFEGLHGEIPWGTIMAASVIAIVPVMILTIFFQKNIVEGLTRGAVKG